MGGAEGVGGGSGFVKIVRFGAVTIRLWSADAKQKETVIEHRQI
jgi:hypothetical protein